MRPGFIALCLLGAVTACAAVHRPPASVASLQAEAVTLASRDRQVRDSVIVRLVRRVQRRGDRTLDVLLLSGGGQNGAFGAGFLRGWRSRSDQPMPRFDLVTGISTGALQAPYALLGTAAAIDTITALYARAAASIAPTVDWWFWLRRTGGVVNTKRFDRTLEQSIHGRFRDELRAAFAEDRQILFASTDFDLGIGRLWSLGDELDTTAAGLQRTRRLLKAATAIPGIFPPVVIDGHVHADGGVVENMLPALDFDDYVRLGAALAAYGVRDVTVRVWVVMNVWSHGEPRVMTPSSRKQMSARSTGLLFYLHQPSTLDRLHNLARAVSAEVPGVRVQLSVALLPSSESTTPGAEQLFERRFMQRLDSIGYSKARSSAPWDVVPSAYRRPER
ncbi:MAG: patatin-like phospholipase family protein [Gemmatimonas sp.]|jgi:predicted acylesterase/phospholipase RssA|uniref:patatin-like phospholipase family protein n=1 Tax=Gemmatimonas sp. TaxID=1962908 RepID=UPI00391F9AF6|nr:patatin-like phospholipase family protein [Gemmatimonadota bacterium]